MLQTIVIVLLFAVGTAIVLTNPSAFQHLMTLRMPGSGGQTMDVTAQTLMIAAGVAPVLAWITGARSA